MLYVKTARLKSCCFSQTHKSKSKSHMLLGPAVLPACCLTPLISQQTFICFKIGKKCALITGQDTVGDRCLQCFVQQQIFCLIIFRLAPQCVCFIWSRLSLLKHTRFYQSQAKFHLEISPRSLWKRTDFSQKWFLFSKITRACDGAASSYATVVLIRSKCFICWAFTHSSAYKLQVYLQILLTVLQRVYVCCCEICPPWAPQMGWWAPFFVTLFRISSVPGRVVSSSPTRSRGPLANSSYQPVVPTERASLTKQQVQKPKRREGVAVFLSCVELVRNQIKQLEC